MEEHDITYQGLIDTVRQLEEENKQKVEVYVRGKKIPQMMYSSEQQGIYKSAVDALLQERKKDREIYTFE